MNMSNLSTAQQPDRLLRRRKSALRSMFQYRANLLGGDAREPLDEVVNRGAVFQVLEQRSDWDACARENPGTADALVDALNRRA